MPSELPQLRVLVVDDDQAICDYVATILEKDGFAVTALSQPTEVERHLRQETFHLVILDLMMPAMDGIEVLKGIRKFDSDIAVVLFTGYPNLESAVEGIKLDAVDYLKKPFQVEELREIVTRVMKKKGLARTPEEQLHRTIGDNVRTLRKEKTLTLKQMSKRTGLSVSLLSQIERAESSASIPSLYKIAVALEVPMSDLFGDFLRSDGPRVRFAAHIICQLFLLVSSSFGPGLMALAVTSGCFMLRRAHVGRFICQPF